MLDWIVTEVARLRTSLGASDSAAMDEFLTQVREVERRIQMVEARNSGGEERAMPDAPSGIPDSWEEHMQLMFDLQVLALQTDCPLNPYGLPVCQACSPTVFALDGSGSFDADGDAISFFWGTTAPSASIATPDQEVTSITLPALLPTQGQTLGTTAEVQLFVSDCQGSVSLDTVTVGVTCTGL